MALIEQFIQDRGFTRARGGCLAFLSTRLPGFHVSGKTALACRGVRQNVAFREVSTLWGYQARRLPPWFTTRFESRYQTIQLFDAGLPKGAGLKGWFKDTLSKAPIEKLAVLRLDGDLYESTMDALNPLYAKVASGGFIIVDDFFAIAQCEQAILDFRATHGISDPIHKIDDAAVYWRKS